MNLAELNNREACEATGTDLSLLLNRALGDMRIAHPNWTSTQVRNFVRQTNPELFGLPKRGELPAKLPEGSARNRALAPGYFPSALSKAVKEFQILNRCSFVTAWDKLRRVRPELFNEEAEAARVQNRETTGEFDADAIQDGIREIRNADPALTYCGARNRLRRDRPEIFGL